MNKKWKALLNHRGKQNKMECASMVKTALLILFIFFFDRPYLYAFQFSPGSQVSLLTCDPGREVYSVFGHSALRVRDTLQQQDLVFNYGTFDFTAPHFLFKFIRGKLHYTLSINRYSDFIENYREEERSVREDVLDFSADEVLRLSAFLTDNYKQENRAYPYDFFFDNCSTRLRDIIEKIKGPELYFAENDGDQKTFQQYLEHYIEDMPWLNTGIDLILGRQSYTTANVRAKTFLPDELEKTVESGYLRTENKPLVMAQHLLYEAPIFPKSLWSRGRGKALLLLLSLLFFFGTDRLFHRKSAGLSRYDRSFYGFIGFLGWFFLFMWLATDHQATYMNPHFLWAWPFFFPLIFFMSSQRYLRGIFKISAAFSLLYLLLTPFVLYPADMMITGLLLYLCWRSYTLGFNT